MKKSFILYLTKQQFATKWTSEHAMALLVDKPSRVNEGGPIPCCPHVWDQPDDTKFVYNMHGGTNSYFLRCVDCFNKDLRPNLPPKYAEELGIPYPNRPKFKISIV